MVKKALVVRHFQQGKGNGTFWEDDAELTEEGIKNGQHTLSLLKEMVDGGLIKLALHPYKSSCLVRAIETINILSEGKYADAEYVERLGPIGEELWEFLFKNFPEAAESETAAMFQNQAAVLLYIEGKNLFDCIRESISEIESGESVILVSHSPLIEAAMAIASGKWQPPEQPISKGDIVIFNFDNLNRFITDSCHAVFGHLRPNPDS